MKPTLRAQRYLLAVGAVLSVAALWWLQTSWSMRFSVAEVRAFIDAYGSLAPLVPGFPFQLISYAAGLTGMSFLAFVTATLGVWSSRRP